MDSKKEEGMMLFRTWILLLWLACNVLAQSAYPSLYAGIGDGVYKSSESYAALMQLESFENEHGALKAYIQHAQQLKQQGFMLDKGEGREQSREYIMALRELAKEKKRLDYAVLKHIRFLKEQKMGAELQLLSSNPDPMIAKAAQAASMQKPEPVKRGMSETAPKDELKHSLMELKIRLLIARNEESPEVQCLNDVTAINYWMVEADRLKSEREWCRAYAACEQVINFERAAAKSCDVKDPLYTKWRKNSSKYRIEYKKEYDKACR